MTASPEPHPSHAPRLRNAQRRLEQAVMHTHSLLPRHGRCGSDAASASTASAPGLMHGVKGPLRRAAPALDPVHHPRTRTEFTHSRFNRGQGLVMPADLATPVALPARCAPDPSRPRTALAALLILAMALAIAAVRALPARPMTARSGPPDCRIQAERYAANLQRVLSCAGHGCRAASAPCALSLGFAAMPWRARYAHNCAPSTLAGDQESRRAAAIVR